MSEEFNFFSAWRSGLSFQDQHYGNLEATDMDIEDGDFSGICVYSSVFRRCKLKESDFSAASFDGCLFRGCDLSEVIFEDITGSNISFVECQMHNVSFRDADLDGLFFIGCEGRILFDGAAIKKTHFNQCDFSNSSFCNTDISGSILVNCNLTKIALNGHTQISKVVLDTTVITDTHIIAASGSGSVKFKGITILPYANWGTRTFGGLQTANRKQTIAEAATSIYSNKSLTARLYCADSKEFRRTGC